MEVRMAALLLPLLAAGPLSAQSYARAEAPAQAGFGAAVAAAGDEVFVGEGRNVLRPGIVYVYGRVREGEWTETAQLMAPEPERGDRFATALAAGQDVLLIGQQREDGPGVVHVFVKRTGGWARSGSLPVGDLEAGDAFGSGIAIGGSLAAVGAPGRGERSGAVYVFRRSERGVWTQEAVLTPAESESGDAFGAALSIDGDRVLVGGPGRGEAAGMAVIFRQDPGSQEWQQEAVLEGRGLERRVAFGAAVSLSGDRALVSAPGYDQRAGAVFEFRHDPLAGEWQEFRQLRPFDSSRGAVFGAAVAYRSGSAYIGAPGAGESGAIYVLTLDRNGDWTSARKLIAPMVDADGSFGASLALGRDVAVAGATGEDYGAGAAVILTRDGAEWTPAVKVLSEDESLAAITGREVRCQAGTVEGAFDCSDVDLLAFMPVKDIGGQRGARTNDVWGWTDESTGREYALVGRNDGTSFVDITDPSKPRYLGDLPMTPGSNAAVWRDIKVYGHHAFIVADGAGQHGMQVFDLTRLRNVPQPVTFDPDARYDRIASAHNVVIDTASGFAFAVGARGGGETCGGGLHMIDIRQPENPTFAGCFADPQTGRASTGYSHDAQCVTYSGPDEDYSGREICLGSNETALSIADVTNKEAPIALARASYPNVGYAHQGWLTEDQRYFYMNDELDELQGKTTNTRTLIWDVSDLDDPQLVGEYMGTTEASDHNLYIRGNLMYQSNYRSGLRIIDISDRESPHEVGFFDTVPYGDNSAGFGGSWSNYPYFPSGTIIVTSGREGLFILKKRGPVS